MSRAALFMFSAASATAVAGCSSTSDTLTPAYGAPFDSAVFETSGDAAVDGSDANRDASTSDTSDTLDSGGPLPAYGLAPDTGTPDTADTSPADTTPADATDGGATPAYGLPPDAD